MESLYCFIPVQDLAACDHRACMITRFDANEEIAILEAVNDAQTEHLISHGYVTVSLEKAREETIKPEWQSNEK